MLQYNPTPIMEIHHEDLGKRSVRLLVKREDMNHPHGPGNKWWKLKNNVARLREEGHTTLLTFGGAYSNHIHATAAVAAAEGIRSIGIIRGERVLPLNPTLAFASRMGMQLEFISRDAYREKSSSGFIRSLKERFGDFYLLPEGGSNDLAVQGCAEFAAEWLARLSFDQLFLPVGTGATIAGIIAGLGDTRKITGVAVLKGADFLKNDIRAFLKNSSAENYGNWDLLTSYHHGGYARTNAELIRFIVNMQAGYNLPLDPVYTGKMMWAVFQELNNGRIPEGSTVLALHTGGLQGAAEQFNLIK